jgi:transposase InsO family protein
MPNLSDSRARPCATRPFASNQEEARRRVGSYRQTTHGSNRTLTIKTSIAWTDNSSDRLRAVPATSDWHQHHLALERQRAGDAISPARDSLQSKGCPVSASRQRHRPNNIEPGSPWENGFAESFFSRLRDELLNREEFANLAEARWFARRRQEEHNHERPHSSLDYQTPARFAAACAASAPAAPALQQHTRRQDKEEDQETQLPVPQPILS